ncbi:MAG: class II fructose-bisphosphate aldolase [bacterium]|nr:class II fructose-bisphosphate aldolase [bacterium]
MLIDLLKTAKEKNFAIGAFNAGGLESLRAIAGAAKKLESPIIVEVSPGEEKYLGLQNFSSLVNNLKEEYGVEIFLNLDHGEDINIITNAIELGFDLVHFDGSKLPFEENIRLCQEVVTMAHSKGVLVEGEMDQIGKKITDPSLAKKFVEETGVDIFAVSIGNKHGMGEDEKLDLERLQEINTVLPETFFSLHGGSGVAPEDVAAAIKLGIVKINVNTELRIAYRETLENVLRGDPEEMAMYKLLPPVIEAVEKVVEEKILLFGSSQN